MGPGHMHEMPRVQWLGKRRQSFKAPPQTLLVEIVNAASAQLWCSLIINFFVLLTRRD
jgi:hypothetical protein